MTEWKTVTVEFPNDGLLKGLTELSAEGWEVLTVVVVNYRGIIVARKVVTPAFSAAKKGKK